LPRREGGSFAGARRVLTQLVLPGGRRDVSRASSPRFAGARVYFAVRPKKPDLFDSLKQDESSRALLGRVLDMDARREGCPASTRPSLIQLGGHHAGAFALTALCFSRAGRGSAFNCGKLGARQAGQL